MSSDGDAQDSRVEGAGRSGRSLIDRVGRHLSLEPRMVYLIALALVSGPSTNGNLAVPAVVDGAREAGLPEKDILQARRLGGAIAMHSISWGLECALEELRDLEPEDVADLDAGALSGPYPGFALAAQQSPTALEVLRAEYDTAVEGSHITSLERTLIFLAIDINCAHMYERGVRTHVRAARTNGVSTRQIVEVGLLAACVGELSLLASVPASSGSGSGPVP